MNLFQVGAYGPSASHLDFSPPNSVKKDQQICTTNAYTTYEKTLGWVFNLKNSDKHNIFFFFKSASRYTGQMQPALIFPGKAQFISKLTYFSINEVSIFFHSSI